MTNFESNVISNVKAVVKVNVIIPASGRGVRFGGKTPKQFIKLEGKEIIAHTIEKFHSIKLIHEIIISAKKEYFKKIKSIIRKNNFYKVTKLVEGGKLRQDSVYNALINLSCSLEDIILIHDAVRPFISKKKILELINQAYRENCVILGLPVSDTVKRTNKKNLIDKTLNRENLWLIQTPQAFRFGILKQSFENSFKDSFIGTDESSIVEHAGYSVKIIEGEKDNIKITDRRDIYQ